MSPQTSDLAHPQSFASTAAAPSYRAVAPATGTTEGVVKVAVHRLRRRFRDLVLAEITETVTAPEDVDEELRHLFEAIRSRPS
jgi:hypothetical protein